MIHVLNTDEDPHYSQVSRGPQESYTVVEQIAEARLKIKTRQLRLRADMNQLLLNKTMFMTMHIRQKQHNSPSQVATTQNKKLRKKNRNYMKNILWLQNLAMQNKSMILTGAWTMYALIKLIYILTGGEKENA